MFRLCLIRFDLDKSPYLHVGFLCVIMFIHIIGTKKEETIGEWIAQNFAEFVGWAAMSFYTAFLFSLVSDVQKQYAAQTPVADHRNT
jgi:hypothetical protein